MSPERCQLKDSKTLSESRGKSKMGWGEKKGQQGKSTGPAQEAREKRKVEKTKHCAMLWQRVRLKKKHGQIQRASFMQRD